MGSLIICPGWTEMCTKQRKTHSLLNLLKYSGLLGVESSISMQTSIMYDCPRASGPVCAGAVILSVFGSKSVLTKSPALPAYRFAVTVKARLSRAFSGVLKSPLKCIRYTSKRWFVFTFRPEVFTYHF